MNLLELTNARPLIFDGAMGTMLQAAGLPAGALPELLNLSHPEQITQIHRAYVLAGSDIVTTNTFQASALKLGDAACVEDVIAAGVRCARAANPRFVALDVGPLGQLMEPMGSLKFDDAYEHFKRQMVAGEASGADLILIETLSDLYEAKAAILAAKENTGLPVICTMSFQQDGRTFTGTDALAASFTLMGLGVDALGVNCSLGPNELLPIVRQMLQYSRVPVAVQPNAGLPDMDGCGAHYNVSPESFSQSVAAMAKLGARILGGCCGTSPDYIRALCAAVAGIAPSPISPEPVTACASASGALVMTGRTSVIGERINPTGKKLLKEALRSGNMDYLLSEAIRQAEAGSDALDVNVGLPELDEPNVLREAVKRIQAVTTLPLVIDSASADAIEAGVRAVSGKPIINSVNGKREVMDRVFPIAKKYGALVVGLTLDERGIPETAEGRLEIAKTMLREAERHGIPRQDLLIDCLTLTASAQQDQVRETLRAIQLVKRELGLLTVLGVSNVSFGLPAREALNATFLAAAFGAGLDAPILNPLSERYRQAVSAWRVLSAEDRDAARYVAMNAAQVAPVGDAALGVPQAPSADVPLCELIRQGRAGEMPGRVRAALEASSPLEIIDSQFIPSLSAVGARFEKGELFLPQLMQSAQAVQAGFEVIRAHMASSGAQQNYRGKILIATVKGDIHDIGKNIVKMLLMNYGYEVIDLGKDVAPEAVVEAARAQDIRLIGLSALMTTTVQSMKQTISAVREAGLPCTFMVGGAVLSPKYAQFVGAEHYARDAMESVAIANELFALS